MEKISVQMQLLWKRRNNTIMVTENKINIHKQNIQTL